MCTLLYMLAEFVDFLGLLEPIVRFAKSRWLRQGKWCNEKLKQYVALESILEIFLEHERTPVNRTFS